MNTISIIETRRVVRRGLRKEQDVHTLFDRLHRWTGLIQARIEGSYTTYREYHDIFIDGKSLQEIFDGGDRMSVLGVGSADVQDYHILQSDQSLT
jgi:hypothetical protein